MTVEINNIPTLGNIPKVSGVARFVAGTVTVSMVGTGVTVTASSGFILTPVTAVAAGVGYQTDVGNNAIIITSSSGADTRFIAWAYIGELL